METKAVDLKQLEQDLIAAARAKAEKIEISMFAERAFWEAVGENPELMTLKEAMDSSETKMRATLDDYATTKKNVAEELTTIDDPEDYKVIDAFSYQQRKQPVMSSDLAMVMAIVDMEAWELLLPNKKLVESFILANTIQAGDGFVLPRWIVNQWQGSIGVSAEIKPTISDKEISKLVARGDDKDGK